VRFTPFGRFVVIGSALFLGATWVRGLFEHPWPAIVTAPFFFLAWTGIAKVCLWFFTTGTLQPPASEPVSADDLGAGLAGAAGVYPGLRGDAAAEDPGSPDDDLSPG
jgi:hypothetical protein